MLLLLLLLLVAMFQGQRHTRAAAPKVQGNGPEGKAGRHKIYPSHISSAPALVLVLIVVHIISVPDKSKAADVNSVRLV
jgi:hypothetical protein